MDAGKVEIVEHTGDIGIRVTAGSREALYKEAALAMVQLICPDAKIQPVKVKNLQASGGDDEQLMVNWLSEINFFFQTEQFLPKEITDLEIENETLNALVSGNSIAPAHGRVKTDIKAVTYHKLYVKQEQGVWMAQIIFDI